LVGAEFFGCGVLAQATLCGCLPRVADMPLDSVNISATVHCPARIPASAASSSGSRRLLTAPARRRETRTKATTLLDAVGLADHHARSTKTNTEN
jgi:hypothetical protein